MEEEFEKVAAERNENVLKLPYNEKAPERDFVNYPGHNLLIHNPMEQDEIEYF